MDTWTAFMNFRDKVLKALGEARNSKLIGKSSEAKLAAYPKQQVREMLKALSVDVTQLLIVSPDYFEVMEADVQVSDNAVVFDDVAITVEKAGRETCGRCRQIRKSVGADKKLPHLCRHYAKIAEAFYPEAVAGGFEED